MKLIKIKANSIHSALAEARREYGEDVMLVESHPADENSLAEIVIGIEAPPQRTSRNRLAGRITLPDHERITRTPVRSSHRQRGTSVGQQGTSVGQQGTTADSIQDESFRDQLASRMIPDAAEAARQLSEAFYTRQSFNRRDVTEATSGEPHTVPESIALDASQSVSKRRSFAPRLRGAAGKLAERLIGDRSIRAIQNEVVGRVNRGNAADSLGTAETDDSPQRPVLEPESMESLAARLQSIERSLSGSSLAFANRWISHPLYSEMTSKGYSAETTIGVLSTLASRGVPPNAELGYLRARVFEEMRRRNRTIVANTRTGRHVFVGTSGSGKTNLILKIANDKATRAAGRTIVLTLGEANGAAAAATSMYAQAGVESLHIHSAQQLKYSLDVLHRYETVLIDTSPLSCSAELRANQCRRIAETLDPLGPVTVHYVIDVRRDLDDVAADMSNGGLTVDSLAITNLDGLTRPGRLIDFLAAHDLPVFFASSKRYEAGAGLDGFAPVELLARSLGIEEWPYSENELSDYFRTASSRSTDRSMDFGGSSSFRVMGMNGKL